jgi:hypothetical protein
MFNSELKEQFRDAWSVYDPDATSFILTSELSSLMFTLGGSFGWDESLKDDPEKQEKCI